MNRYKTVVNDLSSSPESWLITGVAGFIGSNLLERLLKLNQKVIGLDNFSTGFQKNLDIVKNIVTEEQWSNFEFYEGDICDYDMCSRLTKRVDHVLHQAALGSVPRSINDPISSNRANVDGFLNMLQASKEAQVKSFVYAASSSTYGDHPALPKVEEVIGNPLSPYAVTKYVNELYADVYCRTYGFKSVGLRYFNVFGPRQNPGGAYAAVIPKWIDKLASNEDVTINGDGTTSRDFCFIDNVVQMNILASYCHLEEHQIFNVALGDRTSLNELAQFILSSLKASGVKSTSKISYGDFRKGDVKHSQASIEKSAGQLGYDPKFKIKQGIEETVNWFLKQEHRND